MTLSIQTKAGVLQCYRLFLRAGDAAVLHAKHRQPYMRQRIRRRFEEHRTPVTDDRLIDLQRKANNTLELLHLAAEKEGLARKVVKNICDLQYYQNCYETRPPMHTRKLPAPSTCIFAIVALFAAAVSAVPGQHHKGSSIQQDAGGIGNEGRVEGALNNLLKAGILSDNSRVAGTDQDAN
ncbi:uncharacterized protein BYT42DRAFT_614176 [Radiomyces spectabilis]|uniref:uncharacterized protein n=1 Tax=Radiomyces spectabilis TaxID=64574 RepID=UPI00221E5C18|nr:uncharacterized protein BYT42DRAFT_614176 [Radiomyces spectabilis]KAI8377497.1 hypothetical protein BYT42DRAFT_614176 [Radiomyces spectabilis]